MTTAVVKEVFNLSGLRGQNMAKCRLLATVETALLGMTLVSRIQASGTFIAPIEARAG